MVSPGADLERRVGTALGAYVSCVTMLGAACLQRKARILLCASLVFLRLLFNVHVWSEIPSVALHRLNTVYMKGLRRCAGHSRFQKGGLNDLAVRRLLGKPSIESLISQNRLMYFSQLLRSPATQLRALLEVRVGEDRFLGSDSSSGIWRPCNDSMRTNCLN